MSRPTRFATRAVHAGLEPDPPSARSSRPIHQTSTYVQPRARRVRRGLRLLALGEPDARGARARARRARGRPRDARSRPAWPPTHALITAVCDAGDHVVLPRRPLRRHVPARRQGARAAGASRTTWSTRPTSTRVARARARRRRRLIWVETPTNPLLNVVDIAARRRARAATRSSPSTTRSPRRSTSARSSSAPTPSCTRRPSTSAGTPTSSAAPSSLRDADAARAACASCRTRSAPCPGRSTASSSTAACARCTCGWRAHAENARAVGELAARRRRRRATCAGPASAAWSRFRHPRRDRDRRRARRLFTLAESLGGVESLIEVPQAMTHQSVEGSDAAVPADLVRLSCGIEAAEDLVADLAQAMG